MYEPEGERPVIMASIDDTFDDICEMSADRPTGEMIANTRLMLAAPEMRQASQRLYDELQRYLMDVPDSELPHELVEAMDEMETAWHKADGTVPEPADGEAT